MSSRPLFDGPSVCWTLTGLNTVCGRRMSAATIATGNEAHATCPRCLAPHRVRWARKILAADAINRLPEGMNGHA